jgi:hypothetical protein
LLPFTLALVAACTIASAEDEPSKYTALFYDLHNREYSEASIDLDVASVRPIAPDAGFEALKFFNVIIGRASCRERVST